MIADYYKNDLSLDDALALLLGHNLWLYRRQKVDLLHELERTLSYCANDSVEAKERGDEAAVVRCTAAADAASRELEQAGDLYTRLCGEVAKFRTGLPTRIVVAKDDPDEEGYDLVKVSRQSLFEWAKQGRLVVESAHPPPTRKHSTPLLELLDELCREFWEDHDPERPPKNDVILAYVTDKYGDYTSDARTGPNSCEIPGASAKVIESMCTIMRPPKLR